MICYQQQLEHNQLQEVRMNKNVVDSIIASILFTALSTVLGLILQAFGVSPQGSVITAVFALFALMMIFLAVRKFYSTFLRKLTEQLLEKALNVSINETDEAKTAFKRKIVERVQLGSSGIELKQNNSVVEFLNQEACESHIQEVARNAKKVKILTIRGEKYFLGPKSLLYDLYSLKQTTGAKIEVLVLSPESDYITEEHASNLGHRSAEEIREKMRIILNYVAHIAKQHKNFEVRCYNESPNFKILLFDDVMFVSSFAAGTAKNDKNAKMLQITREGDPLFMGLERHFDDLLKRSVPPESILGRRV
ncbi:MAG TPA: hypothetical protein VF043_15865 [Ktedonobacteraceae bacterium]